MKTFSTAIALLLSTQVMAATTAVTCSGTIDGNEIERSYYQLNGEGDSVRVDGAPGFELTLGYNQSLILSYNNDSVYNQEYNSVNLNVNKKYDYINGVSFEQKMNVKCVKIQGF